ncbi:MAG: MFS transporter [Alphaproteobacteria bacterium]|nr:MFS transporter [Alphaproteobacteria bacterium]
MKRELARLVSAQVCLHSCMTGLRMAAPLMLLRQGQTEAAIGVLLSLFALSQVFLALPAGRLSDRWGLRNCFSLSVVVASSGAWLAALWPRTWMLSLAALLTGAACGLVIIALQRHVGRISQDVDELRQAFSWLSIGPAVSNFIGPLSAGVVIDLLGFRAAYVLLGVFPLVSAWLARGVRSKASPRLADAPKPGPAFELLRDAPLRRLLLVNWFLSSCWDVHTFMVPILGHELDVSASAIGTVLGMFALAATFTRTVLPWVARRFKERQIIRAAMWVTGAMLALYPWAPNAWVMGAGSIVLGLFLGAVQPMVMSALHQITPEHRLGQALGLRLMTINASSVGMPLLFGAASATLGAAPVFWIMAASVTLGSHLARKL